jgi:hypothetical protein
VVACMCLGWFWIRLSWIGRYLFPEFAGVADGASNTLPRPVSVTIVLQEQVVTQRQSDPSAGGATTAMTSLWPQSIEYGGLPLSFGSVTAVLQQDAQAARVRACCVRTSPACAPVHPFVRACVCACA